jgi:hypothetical protein
MPFQQEAAIAALSKGLPARVFVTRSDAEGRCVSVGEVDANEAARLIIRGSHRRSTHMEISRFLKISKGD